ncbi:restriction endonuclease [Agreia sp. VKM Ac-1783]|uniref:restriction endonuclease n=1 Tax=Agreia sp. VKM Ac-1783 TaxID=1938889 RepID=UPI000A2AD691|nr:restriction endonuclease [Agreia sp. VKM Ac-1783]SMQ71912.1 Restriction endonuclease Mrr [Agreia sp. VKM Ac-1783]
MATVSYDDPLLGYEALNSDAQAWIDAMLHSTHLPSTSWLVRGKLPDGIRDEIIDLAPTLSTADYVAILRSLLPSGVGLSKMEAFGLAIIKDEIVDRMKRNLSTEYERRYVATVTGQPSAAPTPDLTWILDLAELKPAAMREIALSYLGAHAQWLTDTAIDGLSDFLEMTRSRALSLSNAPGPLGVLENIKPLELELLCAELWESMGYEVVVTPASHDGGRDIVVTLEGVGTSVTILIECKQWHNPVGVQEVRALRGVLDDYDSAKAILVAPGGFTSGSGSATEFAARHKRIELVSADRLLNLLAEHLGERWHLRIDNIIMWRLRFLAERG